MWNKSQTAAHNFSLSKWSNAIALVSNLRLNRFFAKDLLPTYLVPICENKVHCICCSRSKIILFDLFFHCNFNPDMGSLHKIETLLLTSGLPGYISSMNRAPCKANPSWCVGLFYYTWQLFLAVGVTGFWYILLFFLLIFYSNSFSPTSAVLFINCSPGSLRDTFLWCENSSQELTTTAWTGAPIQSGALVEH